MSSLSASMPASNMFSGIRGREVKAFESGTPDRTLDGDVYPKPLEVRGFVNKLPCLLSHGFRSSANLGRMRQSALRSRFLGILKLMMRFSTRQWSWTVDSKLNTEAKTVLRTTK